MDISEHLRGDEHRFVFAGLDAMMRHNSRATKYMSQASTSNPQNAAASLK